jgi:hypothetical protein
MIKALCPKILLVIAFLAFTITFLSVNLYVGPTETPSDSSISSILNGTQTTGLFGWAEAQAKKHENYCADHCRHEYKERLRECKGHKHEHHKDCKKWAKERERECLDECYREHPRHRD